MGIRLESLQEASYLRSQLCQIVNDASCCLVGATNLLLRVSAGCLIFDGLMIFMGAWSLVLMAHGRPEEYRHSSNQSL
ncbi:hypothetical protein BCV71DRAFT_266574 [Rhizopus microsporus]|uniref:Uncharacterized protein n=1 Tax=Rhizopus microsporus TaxID=58291 RepID=A0A1X0RU95_RHIZD|nr:hypothetical protein BCV71DRAFT_266551 [Rhizopus microsporus]ORE15448.1 hypothetical protein BCV71DRAFT_266574 [Rhizopus microsporus]